MKKDNNKENVEVVFTKLNYIIIISSYLLVIVGFILMSGPGTDYENFNPDIFSKRRIMVAPLLCTIGFITLAFGCIVTGKKSVRNNTDKPPQPNQKLKTES